MKKLLLLTIVLFSIQLNAQNIFRLDKPSKAKIKKISPEILNTILFVEIALQKNANKLKEGNTEIYNPYVSSIKSAYKTNRLSDKKIKKIDKIICFDCYQKEWTTQQNAIKKESKPVATKVKKEVTKNPNQKNNFNKQHFAKYRSMTKSEILNFSKVIAKDVRGDFKFFIEKEYKTYIVITFIPSDVSEVNLKKIKEIGLGSSGVEFFNVKYEKFHEGRDLDMEIDGVKKYRFFSVTLKFLDAFKIWKKHFNKDATMQGVRNYKNKTIRIKEKGLDWLYKFNESQSPYWTIIKFY